MEAEIAGSFWPERQSQFAQQGSAGAMRIFALETFDEIGELGCDRAWLPAILPRLGSQRFETAATVAQHPIQQGVHANRSALGAGDLVMPGGNLFGAPRQLTPRQRFQNQRGDQAVTEQGDFFSFGIHREHLPEPEA